MSGIYIASKTRHAHIWKHIRSLGYPVISTWIDEAGPNESASLPDLWDRCIKESSTAKAIVLYREPGEEMKGAFIEVGAALAFGVPVFAVGCCEFSFVNHALVTQCDSLVVALEKAAALSEISIDWKSICDSHGVPVKPVEPVPSHGPMFSHKDCPGNNGSGPKCCDRAGEYNGFPGPQIFTCPNHCGCHD